MKTGLSKKLQRAKDYLNERMSLALDIEVKCQIADWHFGQMLRDGIVVMESEI